MSKFFLRIAVLIFLLASFTAPTYGQSNGPLSSNDPLPPQADASALDYQLSMPAIYVADFSGFLGPYGGSVVVILPDPTNANIVYAGSWGAGVYKSNDGGHNWYAARSGLTNLYINSMAIDPRNHNVLYAGTYKDGVFKSTDGGATWVQSNSGVQSSAIVYTIAVDPENSNRVYIGTRGENTTGQPPWRGVLYRSENGGASWKVALENIGGSSQQDWIYSLAVLPRDPNIILAAAHEHGAYLSRDYGKTWATANNGITDGSGRAVLFDPRYRNPSTAYMGVWHRSGLFKSTDDVRTWSVITSGIADTKIYSMAIDTLNPNRLYATTFIASSGDTGGVLQSSDSGNSWHSAGLKGYSIYNVAVNPANSNTLYAGVYTVGLYRSDDRGGNWTPSEIGMSNIPVAAVLAPAGATTSAYAGTSVVLQTNDRGANWSTLGSGLPTNAVNALVMSPTDPKVIFALTQSVGLYRIDLNAGSTWSKLTDVPATPSLQSNPSPYQPIDELHMLMPDEPATEETTSPDSLPGAAMLAMTFAPSDPNVAYLATSGSGVYRSTNGGISWNSAGLSGQVVTSLAVDSANSNVVYATTGAAGTVKWSTNGGQNWSDTPLPGGTIPYALAAPSSIPGTVYVGTNNGVYKRVAEGAWTLSGLAGRSVTALTAHPSRALTIFAGTTAGAFFTSDGGIGWVSGPAELSMLGIQAISIEPLGGHFVYYATSASGVYEQYLQ